MFCAKNRSKKHEIFEKSDHFKNRPSCKGYSPWKIVSLGQKLKFQRNMSKSFLKMISTCSVQKTAPRKHEIFEKWDHFENRPSCKGYSPCKILTLGQKLKFQKSFLWFRVVLKIHSTNHLQLFCAKNRSKKHEIFEKWDHFENRPSCKGYSPCKILTLGQKLKFQKTCQNPFYKSFRVVLCKKPLEKTRNIREMRPFWKSAIMQRL